MSGVFVMAPGIKADGDRKDRGWDNLPFSNQDYALRQRDGLDCIG